MAFSSKLPDRDETVNSLMMTERDRLETIDAYACPTLELSRAVSVSLGLDPLSSPLSGLNQCPSGAFADCDRAVAVCANSSCGAPELDTPGSASSDGNRLVRGDSSHRVDEFGEVCNGLRQVSCVDQFRSEDMESSQSGTRGSVISRFVCKESGMFMNSIAEVPTSLQATEVGSLKPYSTYSPDANVYRETQGVWCATERAYGERPESHRGTYDGHSFLCKYCGQTSFGPRQPCNCVWYRRGERSGKDGAPVSTVHAYGQVESYPDVIPQGQSTFSTIKTEPSVWVHCTDRGFR